MMKSAHPVPRFSHMTIEANCTALPDRLRGHFLAIDPLHHQVILAKRQREGSTFATEDLGFPLRTEDSTFRPVFLANGPDGAITLADFREEYIAHGQNYQGQIDPESGRIYRLRGRQQALIWDRNLAAKSTVDLVASLSHPNAWHRQTAVRLLGERQDPEVVVPLKALIEQAAEHPALEALWALHQANQLDSSTALNALAHDAPMVRAWSIRLMGDTRRLTTEAMENLASLAASEPDAEVRAQILSTARRLPVDQALPLVWAVARRSIDTEDPFIPLMAWFTLESHCASHPDNILERLGDDLDWWNTALVRRELLPRLMRRFASEGTREGPERCAALFALSPTQATHLALLEGFEQAFAGTAPPVLPESLSQALAAIGKASLAFRVRQGAPDAVEAALRLIPDSQAEPGERLAAIQAFGVHSHPRATAILLELVLGSSNVALRRAAIVALQNDPNPEIGRRLPGLAGGTSRTRPHAAGQPRGMGPEPLHRRRLSLGGSGRKRSHPADVA